MVLVRNWPFLDLLFFGNIGQEKGFYDILKQKHVFLGYKNNNFLKSRKIEMFPKGLTHGFGPNWPFLHPLFLGHIRSGKSVLRYSKTKKRLSRL